eukprot:5593537-Amphidinium_carterae.1
MVSVLGFGHGAMRHRGKGFKFEQSPRTAHSRRKARGNISSGMVMMQPTGQPKRLSQDGALPTTGSSRLGYRVCRNSGELRLAI